MPTRLSAKKALEIIRNSDNTLSVYSDQDVEHFIDKDDDYEENSNDEFELIYFGLVLFLWFDYLIKLLY